jgi:hypothetical protein
MLINQLKKKKNTMQSEQFQKPIENRRMRQNQYLKDKYLTAHFSGLIQAPNKKWRG